MEPRVDLQGNPVMHEMSSLTYGALIDYVNQTYLRHLFLVIEHLLAEKRQYLSASSPLIKLSVFEFDCGDFGRRFNRWRAQQAPQLNSSMLEQLLATGDIEQSGVQRVLQYMAFDGTFAALTKHLPAFIDILNQDSVAPDQAAWLTRLDQLSAAIPLPLIQAHFHVLKSPLLAQIDQVQSRLLQAEKVVNLVEMKKRQVAEVLRVTPEKLARHTLGSHVMSRFPGLLARSPVRVAPKASSDAGAVITFQPELVRHYAPRILAILPAFKSSDAGANDGWVSRWFRKLGGQPSSGHLFAGTQLVLQALEKGSLQEVSVALASFIHYWKLKRGKTEQQAILLTELSRYQLVFDNEAMTAGLPEVDVHRAKAVQESEALRDEIRAQKYRLKKSYGVYDPLRSKSFSDVAKICLKSSKRHIIPDERVLNNSTLAEVNAAVLAIADCLCGDRNHGLFLQEQENGQSCLASHDLNLNRYLVEVYRSDLCPSRVYTLLLIALVIRALDAVVASQFKQVLQQAVATRDLFKAIQSFKGMPEGFKPYFPRWEGLFVKDLQALRSALWALEPAAVSSEGSPQVSLGEVSFYRRKQITEASLSTPKTADTLCRLGDRELCRYAKNVCHQVVTQGPILSKKKKVVSLLEGVLNDKALRPQHESLKFLLAMLQWYREYKIEHKLKYMMSTQQLESLVNAKNDITQVINEIDAYLRKDPQDYHARTGKLYLEALFAIRYKRGCRFGRQESFAKLLAFVALEYRDDQGRVLCDLRHLRSSCVVQPEDSGPGWCMGLFKSRRARERSVVPSAEVEHDGGGSPTISMRSMVE